MTADNARATYVHENVPGASDDSHELGGTQKLQVDCEFHSLGRNRMR